MQFDDNAYSDDQPASTGPSTMDDAYVDDGLDYTNTGATMIDDAAYTYSATVVTGATVVTNATVVMNATVVTGATVATGVDDAYTYTGSTL